VTAAATADQVRRVMADVLGLDVGALGLDASPDTVPAWDSVQHLSLIIALEQEFAVRFAPEEIEEAVSVAAIVGLVSRKQQRGR
jgi:acyl carrier protein